MHLFQDHTPQDRRPRGHALTRGVAARPMRRFHAAVAALLLAAASTGCGGGASSAQAPGAAAPAEALTRLIDDLRRDDLAGFARHSVPPALHARLAIAWSEGRTSWPLTELPLEDRLPSAIAALAAKDSEKTLLAAYHRQFAHADGELRSAAATIGLFAAQYVRSEGDYSTEERGHYVQLIAALSDWGRQAPLGDPALAKATLGQLATAARATGIKDRDTFARAGMERTLGRLGPLAWRLRGVLLRYGLDIDATLASARVAVIEHNGDQARLRLTYTLGDKAIDAVVLAERREGRWYLRDLLRHAEVEAARTGTPREAPTSVVQHNGEAPPPRPASDAHH
ncbi:hypothetical protein EER27_10425 [Lysobacter psychrotolerans]|uniref:Uncharacterized protein n=2 Tax=Montanilutibacter psychrotolerans TaxID=1327343 RepID=A0A3M8SSU9_9GAMM|nr:hypothetical protein EER27_10425 [Lysobacter psychrotolerans]